MANENFGNFTDGGVPTSGEYVVGHNSGGTNEERWTVGNLTASPYFEQSLSAAQKDQLKDNAGVKFWHSFEPIAYNEQWTVTQYPSLHIPWKARILEVKAFMETAGNASSFFNIQVGDSELELLDTALELGSAGWYSVAEVDLNNTNFGTPAVIPASSIVQINVTDRGAGTANAPAEGLQVFLLLQLLEN